VSRDLPHHNVKEEYTMGTINEVREILSANSSKERSEIVTLVVDKFGCTRALAHSYVYHAQKKSAKKADKPAKVAPKKVAKKVERKKDVVAVKAKNLETLKTVAKKQRVAKNVDTDLNPQLLREEVNQIIAEIDRNGKAGIPKFLHKDFEGLDLAEV
jgi:hypothetical protein